MKWRTVTLEDLSAENKQRVWKYLQEKKPGLARMIKEDPWLKKIKETFNGKTEVEVDADILL